jgi:hypothetical protein
MKRDIGMTSDESKLQGDDLQQLVGLIGKRGGFELKNRPEIVDWIYESLENPTDIVPHRLVVSMLTEIAWNKRVKNTTKPH